MAKDKDAGITGDFGRGLLLGGITLFGMLLAKSFFPAANFLIPRVPASIADTFRGFLIVFGAPILEEPLFRKVIYEKFRSYGIGKNISNLLQAAIFGLFHTFAYGLPLGNLDRFVEIFGYFNAVAGSILAAMVFGFMMRVILDQTARKGKTPNLLVPIIVHLGLNAAVYFSLTVVS